MKKCFYGLMLGCFLIPNLGFAGPFGAEMGDTPDKFKPYTDNQVQYYDNYYALYTTSMPKSHSVFKEYQLSFSQGIGLYKIKAISERMNPYCDPEKEYIPGTFGEALCKGKPNPQKEYKKVQKQLQNKYGQPSEVTEDKANDSAISKWQSVNSDNIDTIELRTVKQNADVIIMLSYLFKNKNTNTIKRDAADADSL